MPTLSSELDEILSGCGTAGIVVEDPEMPYEPDDRELAAERVVERRATRQAAQRPEAPRGWGRQQQYDSRDMPDESEFRVPLGFVDRKRPPPEMLPDIPRDDYLESILRETSGPSPFDHMDRRSLPTSPIPQSAPAPRQVQQAEPLTDRGVIDGVLQILQQLLPVLTDLQTRLQAIK